MLSRRIFKSTTIVRSSTGSDHYHLWLWSVVLGCIALLFVIISVATPGWTGISLIKDCNKNCLSTIVLTFMAIVFLLLALISTIVFGTRLITNFANGIKLSVIVLFTFAGIFIVAAYSSYLAYSTRNYSYYLMVTSGILTFVSSIIVSFWLGRNWVII